MKKPPNDTKHAEPLIQLVSSLLADPRPRSYHSVAGLLVIKPIDSLIQYST